METTIIYWGLYRDNGKEHGNYQNGLYRDYRVYIGITLGEWKRKWKLPKWVI